MASEHRYTQALPGVDAYFRGLSVDPEDSRTKALGSTADKPIKSCWDHILTRPEYEAWHDSKGTSVLWVVGGPGKGKTILSLGLVDEFSNAVQPAGGKAFVGYFFCRYMDSSTNTSIAILKGLIYGLSQNDRDLMHYLSDKFKSPADIKGAGVDTLWGILSKMLAASKGLEAVYFVVDALDECRDEDQVNDFLNLVRKDSLRRCVKWVFTSRQSHQFRRSLGSRAEVHTIDLDTSKKVEESVDEYLKIMVNESQQFLGPHKLKVLDMMEAKAEKTFLYASLVLEDLRTASDPDVSQWLTDLENNVHGESVYRRYRFMLQRVLERDQKSGTTTHQNLLKAVLMASESLSLPELAIVASLPPEFYDPNPESGSYRRTAELVQECGHILRVTDNDKVDLVHKSAKDYLTLGDGGDEAPFLSSSSPTEHSLVAERCLQAIGPELLPIPDLSTMESIKVRPLSPGVFQKMKALQYIYCNWSKHVVQAQGAFTNWSLVEGFLKERLLPWIEVMGWLDQIQRCVDAVQELRASMDHHAHSDTTPERIKDLLDDAFQFLVRYRLLLQVHPRQVYLLAKYFTPKSSPLRKNHEHILCCLTISSDPPMDWDPCQYTLAISGQQWGEKDQRKVTVPCYDRSGINLFRGYFSFTSRDFRLSFSADSKTLSIGSSTLGRNILRWNVSDGSFAGSFDAVEDGLAHSDDGRFLVSWSEKGIGVWNVEANRLVCRLEDSDEPCRYTAVRFAGNGSAIAIAFEKSSMFQKRKRGIKLWDAKNESLLRNIDVGDDIEDFSFLPGDGILAVYSDKALLLHDVRGHNTRKTSLEITSEPNGVAFSDDGSILVVITRSVVTFYHVDPHYEITKWSVPEVDAGLYRYFCQEDKWSRPKPSFGMKVAVSKDAKTAVLSFRDIIAFFYLDENHISPTYHCTSNYQGSIKDEDFFQSKLPIIDAVKFSPCGLYLVCARNDDIISIWDVQASRRLPADKPGILKGPEPMTPRGRHVPGMSRIPTYSPDGRVCGTTSTDHITLWDVEAALVKLHWKHTASCSSTDDPRHHLPAWVFSPDSKSALMTVRRKLYLINIRDWTFMDKTLPGHVSVLTFSSEGTHFALATSTSPPLVLVFSTAFVKCVLRYEAPCQNIHAMAFSPSGTLVAAGATSKHFCYYSWEKSDYANLDPSRTPRRHQTSRRGDGSSLGTGYSKIMRIEFSPDNITTVSIICLFGFMVSGQLTYVADAEMTVWKSPTITSRRTEIIDDGSLESVNYLEVKVQSDGEYLAWEKELAVSPTDDLAVSSRFGQGTGGMTVEGIDVPAPTEGSRTTCKGVEIEKDGRFNWLTWNNQRLLCFPMSISQVCRDLWDECLMITQEPDNVSFVFFSRHN